MLNAYLFINIAKNGPSYSKENDVSEIGREDCQSRRMYFHSYKVFNSDGIEKPVLQQQRQWKQVKK